MIVHKERKQGLNDGKRESSCGNNNNDDQIITDAQQPYNRCITSIQQIRNNYITDE